MADGKLRKERDAFDEISDLGKQSGLLGGLSSSKADLEELEREEKQNQNTGEKPRRQRKKNSTKGPLASIDEGGSQTGRERIFVRLSEESNDWLHTVTTETRRRSGRKINKEVLVQAAVDLLISSPIDWRQIDSVEDLRISVQSLIEVLNSD